jgi:phosphoserine aminotransferase
MIGLVLEWLKDLGGIGVITQRNHEKAEFLYKFLDNSKLFFSPVEKPFRSLMNIPFKLKIDEDARRVEIEGRFVKEAAANGLVNLAGHRLVGGMRASIYNAMPIQGVKALVDFMKKFENAYT